MNQIFDNWGFAQEDVNTFILRDFSNPQVTFKVNVMVIVDGEGSRLSPYLFTVKVFGESEKEALTIKTTNHISMVDFLLRQMYYHEKVN